MVPEGWSVEPWDYPDLLWREKLYAEGVMRDPDEIEWSTKIVAESGKYYRPVEDPAKVEPLFRGRVLSTCWCGYAAVVVTWEQVRAHETETCKRKRCKIIAAMSPGARLALVPINKTAMGPKFHANMRNGSSD